MALIDEARTPTYTLEPRQEALYTHRCDVVSVVQPESDTDTGDIGGPTLRRLWKDVPCRYTQTPNVDDAADIGRIKRMTTLTLDEIHFHTSQELKDGWFVVARSPSAFTGTVHRVEGAPRQFPSFAKKQSVLAMVDEHPPQDISDFYGLT